MKLILNRIMATITLTFVFFSPINADPVKPLFQKLKQLHKVEFEGYSGYLFKQSIQFDEENPSYSVYINNIQYDTVLDDGRGTSKKAFKCPKENFFDEDPTTGCAITFDGEYLIENVSSSSSQIKIETKIWNLEFIK